MLNISIEVTKYLTLILFAIYTFKCFSVFTKGDVLKQNSLLKTQTAVIFMIHFMNYFVLFIAAEDKIRLLTLYGGEVLLLILTIAIYNGLYPKGSRLITNNICMMLIIGYIMLARINIDTAVKQLVLSSIAIVISFIVPVIVRKWKALRNFRYIYAILGLTALLVVFLLATVSGGAKLSITIGGFSLQLSEFVKILFVFFVASSLKEDTSIRNIVITSCFAAAHVLILVLSTDLGAAVIMFVVYLLMLYVATQQKLWLLAGAGAGALSAVIAYKLFNHVRIRVQVWKDPFADWDHGYQIGQSLFAIGTGSWLGMGLTKGSPTKIPVVKSDFIFASIAEEFGIILSLFLILICLSCYIMFLNIALQIRDKFYKLVALGLGTCYIFQVFLNIGGVIKFIPSTGVTLPWISYGGSSLLSTAIMFAIIQGLYMLREDEDLEFERKAIEFGQQKTERKNRGRSSI